MPAQGCLIEEFPDLPPFDPDTIQPDDLQLINSPRKSGKTTLLFHWLLFMAPKIVIPLVVSHSEEGNHFFEQRVGIPLQFVNFQFEERIIHNAITRQRKMKLCPPPGYTFEEHGAMHIFLEDCMDDARHVFGNRSMSYLMKNGRHMKIGSSILSQYMVCINKENRSQFDRVALLHDENGSNREFAFRNCFSGIKGGWEAFNYYYTKYTEDHGAFVYSKNAPLTHRYTWFRADPKIMDDPAYVPVWNAAATFKTFAEHYPVLPEPEIACNWNKLDLGLKV